MTTNPSITSTPQVPKKWWAINANDLHSMIQLAVLGVQVILLINLAQRMTALEQVISGSSGDIPAAPIVERIPDERGQVLGPIEAKVTIVEFGDFQCPYCAQAVEPLKQLIAAYPNDIRFVYRHYPLTSVHEDAFQAALAGECAAAQGQFWEMHDLLFSHQTALNAVYLPGYVEELDLNTSKFNTCLEDEATIQAIHQDMSDGIKYQVIGTPTFFINNQMVMSMSELEVRVKQALATP